MDTSTDIRNQSTRAHVTITNPLNRVTVLKALENQGSGGTPADVIVHIELEDDGGHVGFVRARVAGFVHDVVASPNVATAHLRFNATRGSGQLGGEVARITADRLIAVVFSVDRRRLTDGIIELDEMPVIH